jgi:prephenate dehydratase
MTVGLQTRIDHIPGCMLDAGYEPGDGVAIQAATDVPGRIKSYHRLAAEAASYGRQVETVPFATFQEAIGAVRIGRVRFGVAAEYSTRSPNVLIGDAGEPANIELLEADSGLAILGRVAVGVRFSLIGLADGVDNPDDVRTVLLQRSANVDLQCSSFMATRLFLANQANCSDGIAAVDLLTRRRDQSRLTTAVIAAPAALGLSGTRELASDIQDGQPQTIFTVFSRA